MYFLVRSFGWLMVTLMFAFVINTFLTLGMAWPEISLLFNNNNKSLNSIQFIKIFFEISIYCIAIFGVIYFSFRYKDQSLRKDSLVLMTKPLQAY